MNDSDKILSDYTRNELNIYSNEDYKAILKRWPNDEDMIVYRGINFPTQKDHDVFFEDHKRNGGYITSNASGFAKSKETAKNFASTTKTYFPTLEVMQRESARTAMFEDVTGYGGVILKTVVKKGEVVDVTKSPHAIEDEVLFAPGKIIECEIEHVKTYKQIVNAENFDKNKHIQNNDIESGLSKYIIGNHADKLSSKSRNHILTGELLLVEKFLNRFESDKDVEEIDKGKYWLAYIITSYNYRNKDTEKEQQMKFIVPDFKSKDLNGLWNPAQLKKIKEISTDIMYSVLQVHLQYRDKYEIDYSHLQDLTPFLNKHLVELYDRAISYKKRNQYETINDNLRKLYSQKTGERKLDSRAINDEIEKIKKLFTSISTSSSKTNEQRLEDKKTYQEERQRKIKNANI